MRVLIYYLALGLVLARPCASRGDEDEADGGDHRVDVRTVSGKVTSVAWLEHKLTIEAADGSVTLEVDRNTSVFLDDRLGSLRDLEVGSPVRASFGSDERAVWVEVRSSGVPSAAGLPGAAGADFRGMADGGTEAGPPVLPAPGLDAGTAGGGRVSAAGTPQPPSASPDAGAPSPAPGSAPAGPPPPEPTRGGASAPPPQPRPVGPSPVPGGAWQR